MPLENVRAGKYQIMPAMTQEEYDLLKEDIRSNGVLEAIVFDQDGAIVDGHHRFEAWGDLMDEGHNVEMFPRIDLNFATAEDRVAYSISKNLKRRHMTREQRQELAYRLRMPPHSMTMTKIATMLGVSVKTIWWDLEELPDDAKKELEEVQQVVGQDGKVYPTHQIRIGDQAYVSPDKSVKQMHQQVKGVDAAPVTETKREEVQRKWEVKVGQVWEIPSKSAPGTSHRVGCGDSRDLSFVADVFGTGGASLLLTDPPYGVNYVGKTKDKLELDNDDKVGLEQLLLDAFGVAANFVEESSPFYICHPPGPLSWVFGDVLRALEWRMHETLVWVKQTMVLGHSDYHLRHEPIYYGWLPGSGRPGRGTPLDQGGKWYGDDSQTSTLFFDRPARSEEHPTMKPTDLIVKCLQNSSGFQNGVYDPFVGSGSVVAACEQVGRVAYAIDIDPENIALTLDRMVAMGLTPKLIGQE
jgi:hypothetical protein